MKWALVLALVLCCGSARGQNVNEGGGTEDNSDKCEGINCENGIVCKEGKCPCTTGLSGDLCQIVDGCATLKSTCEAFDKDCIYDPNREDKATCDCGVDKKFDGTECKETCDGDANKCAFDSVCELIDGYSFCKCSNGLTGDKCDVITDCQPSGKYENCDKAGGNCTHDGTNSVCLCEDNKKYDTESETCRATCDPTKTDCANGANCEAQDGKNFCTCVQGLTGDFCQVITDCQKGKKYENCTDFDGHNCTFSNDVKKAVCECAEDKQFDTKKGLCRKTCENDDQCDFSTQCKPIDRYSFCVCANGLTGDKCEVIIDCLPSGKYANCKKANGTCWWDIAKNSHCDCKDGKEYDTLSEACRGTCDENTKKCENGAKCEVQDGKNFCTCVPGLTGDLCQVITDCEKGGKYENCTGDGHKCSFSNDADVGKAVCECGGGKQFDTKKGLCRSTCDENTKKCGNGAKCEAQGGQNFCTCVEGLTGDLCSTINECQPSGKYGKCENSGGKCTFSGGSAACSCGTGKLFDLTEGVCKDACGSEICRNGAQCKDGKCECPTGLSGKDCGTVEGCTEDLETICKKISSKCIYDSKKENKASCNCTKDQKFDGENCKDCSCGGNEECFFDEKKDKQCPCVEKFSKNNGTCEECDCGEFGACTFVEGNKKCNCNDKYKEKKGVCDVCDCGEHGTCSFDENGKKICACNDKFADKNGMCVDCECGEEVKSCQFSNDGVKTCNCNSKYEDNDGTCSECDCGEINKEAKSCKFSKGEKECDCVSLYAPEDGMCTACDCGNKTVVEGCEFKDDGTICKCKNGYSQKEKTCEVCNCGKNGNCSFVNGNKVCACKDLYEEDNGTCKNCDCGKSGKCSFEDHKKKCACDKGFDELDGKCQVCDCGDDGDCKFINNKKNCTCNDGYLDKNGICTEPCKTDEDCHHNTSCTETKVGSFCDCKDIFTGHKCEKVVACETGYLRNCEATGGKCSYNIKEKKAVCECVEEKKFDGNLNICRGKCKPEEETCKHGGKCQDELCKCPTGTSGDDCSTVDGCDTDLEKKCEDISAKCVYDSTTSSATCQCNSTDLMYKDNKCKAKWCESNPCKAGDSVCVYGFRSAFCKCTKIGTYYDYATNNCIDIDKCPLFPCKENEYCTDDGKCACDENLVQDKGECKNERKKLCDSKPCSLNATCHEGKAIGTVKCECPRDTYFNAKSTCEVMIKEEEKCKDGKDCGPFGYCVRKGNTSTCTCKKELAVLDKDTGVCILNGKNACLSKTVLSNNPKKCNCSGTLKDSTNGITCEYMTCGDEAAQDDCKKKGAFCVDVKNSNNQKSYQCKCSAGQKLTTDKGCVDACSDKAKECSKNQQACYLDENGFGTCKCPPGFTEIKTDGKTTCQLNVQFSYLLKGLPVKEEEFLNKDQSVNKVKLNQYVIKSMKAVSSQSYVFASVQNYRISDFAILCDVWLQFSKDAEQDVKRWRSQVAIRNGSIVLPPSLKLSSVELGLVTYEKLEFCSPIVYQTACGRQGSKCDKDKKACYCSDGYEVVGPSIQVIDGNTVLRCEDIDECNENKHSCKANSQCMNTMGGYYCKCNPGFHKKDQNESEDCLGLCSSNPCNDGDCTVKENRVECSCKAGFKGSYCTESDDKLKKAQSSTKIVGGVLGAILAVTFVAIIAYVVKLKKNSYSEDFSSSPRDNSEMAERPLRGVSNRGYQ